MAISITEVKTLYLAGGFGNYIDPQEAVGDRSAPPEMADKVILIGTEPGAGAKWPPSLSGLSRKALANPG